MWTKSGQACLILIFRTNTNCENMAYRSFRSEKYSATGVRKVTTGITGLWQPSVRSDVAFLILRGRLFLSLRRRSPKVSDCSPANRERELGLDSREKECVYINIYVKCIQCLGSSLYQNSQACCLFHSEFTVSLQTLSEPSAVLSPAVL